MTRTARGECSYCHRRQRITQKGLLYGHPASGVDCFGSGTYPVDGTVAEPTPPPTGTWLDRHHDEVYYLCMAVFVFVAGIALGLGLAALGWA